MALTITHATVASDPQSPLLGATEWNENHQISGSIDWGSITGTLSDQTDLQTALKAKANLNGAAFTGNVTAPAFIPNSATVPTNGLYLPAANTLGLGINSARRMQINSAGAMDLGNGSVGGSAASLTINTNLNNTLILDSSASSVSIVLKSSSGSTNYEFYASYGNFGVYNGASFQTPFGISGSGTSTILRTNSGGTYGWSSSSSSAIYASADTGLSRVSAGVVAIGNGTQGNASGSLNVANINGVPLTSAGSSLNYLREDGTYGTPFDGLAKITVGTTAPSSPSTGDLWIDTN